MNSEADKLVQEIAGMIYESAQLESTGWKHAISRFQFFDGACKDTFSWVSTDGDVNFYFPDLDIEIDEKVELLRECSAVEGRKWIVCLVIVSADRKIRIDFEHEDSERWDPNKFEGLAN